jgi:hypothetical protein
LGQWCLRVKDFKQLNRRTLRIILEDMDNLSDDLEQRVLDQIARHQERLKGPDRVRSTIVKVFDPLAQGWQAEARGLPDRFRFVLHKVFKNRQL